MYLSDTEITSVEQYLMKEYPLNNTSQSTAEKNKIDIDDFAQEMGMIIK